MQRIAIVGSGVIGLSIACRLAELGSDNISVTIISGQSPLETTSAVAAAYWSPYWIGGYDRTWASSTLDQLQSMATSSSPDMGLQIVEFREWLDEAGAEELTNVIDEAYWWRNLPGIDFSWEKLNEPIPIVLPKLGAFAFTSEVRFHTVVARMPDYLSYLQKRALGSGRAVVESRWIERLEPLLDSFDTVINCTGWGAKRLVSHDPETAAMRLLAGHVVRVETQSLPYATSLHRSSFKQRPLYIVPRRGSTDDAICGGTAIEILGDIDPRRPFDFPISEVCDEIHQLCCAFSPGIASGQRRENLVGLRPMRSSVRIERDLLQSRLLHCYGHGGSGLTLSWGSADQVMKLLELR